MKQKNRIKRLEARQTEYDTMLQNADSVEKVSLANSHKRPGSMKK